MFTKRITLILAMLSLSACGSSPPPEASSAPAAPAAEAAATAATQPDATAAKKHLAEHVTYPATRAQVLAACADTPEFSAGEKQWLSDHLAEGNYASADDVNKALGL